LYRGIVKMYGSAVETHTVEMHCSASLQRRYVLTNASTNYSSLFNNVNRAGNGSVFLFV